MASIKTYHNSWRPIYNTESKRSRKNFQFKPFLLSASAIKNEFSVQDLFNRSLLGSWLAWRLGMKTGRRAGIPVRLFDALLRTCYRSMEKKRETLDNVFSCRTKRLCQLWVKGRFRLYSVNSKKFRGTKDCTGFLSYVRDTTSCDKAWFQITMGSVVKFSIGWGRFGFISGSECGKLPPVMLHYASKINR